MSRERVVRHAERLYAWLFRGLPAELVSEHGMEARSDFGVMVRRSRGGVAGIAWTLVRAALDVARRMPVEHWRSRAERRRTPVADAGTGGGEGGGRGGGDRFRDGLTGLAQALRALRRRPGYTAIAVVTLGLGIGANVALFTVVDSVLLRPLAYPESERIVQIRHHAPGINLPELNNAPGLIDLYRREARTLESVTVVNVVEANLFGDDRPSRVRIVSTDMEFFDVFGTRPLLGRAFDAADVQRDASPVAILMYGTWQTRFGGDPSILGQRIELDGESTEIIGVMPRGFAYPDARTVALVPEYLDLSDGFSSFGLRGFGRIADGSTLEAARVEITGLQRRLPDVWTDVQPEFLERAGWSVTVDRLRDLTVEDIERALWVLFGTVGIVLLIAGANVANLFLVRAESRRREVAIRSALGATRRRLASTFLAESLLLGAGGGLIGIVMALAGIRVLVAAGPAGLPRLEEIGVDGLSLLFAALLSVVAGVILGALPMLGPARGSDAGTLREGGRTSTAGRGRLRARNLLIMSQVAMALVLLIGSGLMLRSVVRLGHANAGIDPKGVTTVGIAWGEGDRADAARFYDRVLEQAAAIPGVESIGAVNALPLDPHGLNGGSFHIVSRPTAEDEIPSTAMYSAVTPGFFETLRIDLVEGRYPQRADQTGGPPVVWISERFAREQFPDGALGERIWFGADTLPAEIVGVVGDVRTWGMREDEGLMAYFPLTTSASVDLGLMNFVLRTRGDAGAMVQAMRQTVSRIDPRVPLTTVRTMDQVLASSVAELSFTMVLLAIAAVVALMLGAVGLYGVISWVVAQRRHEMGVRIALGARPADVRDMVVRQGLQVTLAGIAIGIVCALGATRILASLLFEVSATDPLTFIATPMLLTGVGALAAWLPARRAAAADPLQAMRQE